MPVCLTYTCPIPVAARWFVVECLTHATIFLWNQRPDPHGLGKPALQVVRSATPQEIAARVNVDRKRALEHARNAVPDGTQGEARHIEQIVYAQSDGDTRLAWRIELAVHLTADFVVVIDAADGALGDVAGLFVL